MQLFVSTCSELMPGIGAVCAGLKGGGWGCVSRWRRCEGWAVCRVVVEGWGLHAQVDFSQSVHHLWKQYRRHGKAGGAEEAAAARGRRRRRQKPGARAGQRAGRWRAAGQAGAEARRRGTVRGACRCGGSPVGPGFRGPGLGFRG